MAARTAHPASTQQQLSPRLRRRKELILTQPEPSKVEQPPDSVLLKQGSLFLLADAAGDVPWTLPHALGLFLEDCRFLDGFRLRLNGQDLTVLLHAGARGFETRHALTNPELPPVNGGAVVPKNTLGIRRHRLIHGGVLHEVLTIDNFGAAPACLEVSLEFRSKFQDIYVVKGFIHQPPGTLHAPRVVSDRTVELRRDGADRWIRTTVIAFSEAPDPLEPQRARFRWTIPPGAQHELKVSITPSEHREEHHQRRPPDPRERHSQHLLPRLKQTEDIWLASAANLRSSNPLFDRVLRRALLDLRLLRSRLHGLHYFAAGIPWFATLFGRDAATVAIQSLPYGPDVARDTLLLLARYQATTVDAYRDAEPGKILHELRSGELAQTDAIPQSPAYYGTVDATMLFVILLAEYVNWTGNLDLARRLRPNLDAALHWMDAYADHDGDGYLDYVGKYENGLVNQGWKDAGNSIPDADGALPDPPIALCEVQAYAYRAWRQAADVLRALGDDARADELDRKASDLQERFERDFWSDDLGCYRLGRQAGGRPIDVVSSNTGQVLWGGIASRDRAERVAQRLLQSDMFSGWGIRTLSSEATAYNPIGYHLGTVWPHDNCLIVAGLQRYDCSDAALKVFGAIFEAASNLRDERLPELYSGLARTDEQDRPVGYPVACRPQAWAAGALPHGLWNLLGLHPEALNGVLYLVRPRLPPGVDWLELNQVPVGNATVNLRLERTDGEAPRVSCEVQGDGLRVERRDDLLASDLFDRG